MNKLGEEYGELCRAVNKGNQDETIDALGDMYVVMVQVAMQHGTSIEQCIAAAYEEIKDRKGKMVNGVFVKEADLK
ncbi:MazG nucleotide pyrophosphohydrolase domain-containing protein [Sporosarcina sp. P37]|uniref:MazG nucleotide pyrophosphohydrolase domain-containing protein n=1 Tax=Sporosarcina sp. P37 TaxID=1930546 RepID=UPI001E29631A|nr:MazG nucleotide pyrophosphohydrolase domain-containing protein [Sporosarcina sp. P37]